MKQIYVSDDGIKRGTEEEVLKYEKELSEKVARDRKLKEEKESRKKEIDEKTEELTNLISSYYKDYHEIRISNRLEPNTLDFNTLFGGLF